MLLCIKIIFWPFIYHPFCIFIRRKFYAIPNSKFYFCNILLTSLLFSLLICKSSSLSMFNHLLYNYFNLCICFDFFNCMRYVLKVSTLLNISWETMKVGGVVIGRVWACHMYIIRCYFSARKYIVSIENIHSKFAIESGVPQGSCLGTILFNAYIHELPSLK